MRTSRKLSRTDCRPLVRLCEAAPRCVLRPTPPVHQPQTSPPSSYASGSATPVVEAQAARYNQVHFNGEWGFCGGQVDAVASRCSPSLTRPQPCNAAGTLQRKCVNYDCMTSAARYQAANRSDGTTVAPPLFCIVDGTATDGADFSRLVRQGLSALFEFVLLQPDKPIHLRWVGGVWLRIRTEL